MSTTSEVKVSSNGHKTAVPVLSAWELRKAHALVGCLGDPLAVHDALWALFLERASEIVKSNRRISEQRIAIKAVATDLGFKLSNQEIADLYDLFDTAVTAYEPDV